MSVPLDQIPAPQLTLVDQLVQWGRRRIDERVFRPGMRMPSISKFAVDKGMPRFTVVEAYEQLVAHGYLDSRRGSGFFVRDRTSSNDSRVHPTLATECAPVPSTIDVVWLLRNMLHTSSPAKGPGIGYLPAAG